MESPTLDGDEARTTTADRSPSSTVVTAVAEAEGVGETDLPPLFHAIDPDALDALFRADSHRAGETRTEGSITFRYHDYDVSVRADGRVDVQARAIR